MVGGRRASRVSFMRTVMPAGRLHPHDLSCSLKPHLQRPSPWGPGFTSRIWGGGTAIQSVSRSEVLNQRQRVSCVAVSSLHRAPNHVNVSKGPVAQSQILSRSSVTCLSPLLPIRKDLWGTQLVLCVLQGTCDFTSEWDMDYDLIRITTEPAR